MDKRETILAGLAAKRVDPATGRTVGSIDWGYWANLHAVGCWEACVLSLGFEPRAIKGNALPQALDAKIRQRHDIAGDHLGKLLPAHSIGTDRHYERGPSGVRLPEFRAWAESLPHPFDFPEGFPEATPKCDTEDAKKPAKERPLGERERVTLLRIIRALDVMAELPERGPTTSILTQLQQLGFSSPAEDTIRKTITAARELEAD